jgi:TRAP transporter 4TM/12TM fusion protein
MHLFFSLTLGYMIYVGWKKASRTRVNAYDWVMIALSAVTSLYIALNAYDISARMAYVDPVTVLQMAFAVIFAILLLQLCARAVGKPVAIIAIIFSIYALFGPYMPGAFRHTGITLKRYLEYLYLTDSGIFGVTLATCSTYVSTFIIFGVFIEKCGAGDFLLQLGLSAASGLKGGPAKSSVIASSIMGTTMGSSIANVYCTGQFTIPLMKKSGFRPEKAGAIEAVASTCSQIMPPVMGSSAFLIADALGVSYSKVCLAAIFPAILYCISIYCMVHLEALKMNIPRGKGAEKGEMRELWKKNWFLLLPIAGLIYMLILQYTAFYAALICAGFAVIVSWFHPKYRMTPKKIFEAFSAAGQRIIVMAAALSCAGITVAAIQVSGLGVKFSKILLSIASGQSLPLLILTAISCMILGMGLPATACYILTSLFTVPALIDLGFLPISAHMFIYNFAILAAITPPVAMAAYAGAELAGANLNKVGWNAFALG